MDSTSPMTDRALWHYGLAARMCAREFRPYFESEEEKSVLKELGLNQIIGLIAYAVSEVEERATVHPVLLIRSGAPPHLTPYTLSIGHVSQYQQWFITPLGIKSHDQLAIYLHPEGKLRPAGEWGPADYLAVQESGVHPLEALSCSEKELAEDFARRFSYWVRQAQARDLSRATQASSGQISEKTRL